MARGTHGFTIVELLVVITIIVVLVALLTPALDTAVYQAELATCAGRLQAQARAVSTYAVANRRSYPQPQGPRTGGQPDLLYWGSRPQWNVGGLLFGQYLSPDAFLDPLGGEGALDLSPEANRNALNDRTQVYANYNLWFGGQLPDEKGMLRFGNRLTWTDPYTSRVNHFNVLASDINLVADPDKDGTATTGTQSSHCDRDQTMSMYAFQNESPGGIWLALAEATISRWAGPLERGSLDLNYAIDDGSVPRFTQVRATLEDEPRLRRLPSNFAGTAPEWRIHIPAAN